MLLYPQVFCNAGVLISVCFNAESILFNVVVLLYVVKNADVCRLLHTVFMILHFTISEYHFPTNCAPYVCSCDTLFKIIKSWQHFHFSQKCIQSRNPSPLTVICKFQIQQNNVHGTRMLLQKPDDLPMPTLIGNITVRYWADTEISREAIIHNNILKLM